MELQFDGPDYIAFVMRHLKVNPAERPTAKQVLNDPYLADALDHRNEFKGFVTKVLS